MDDYYEPSNADRQIRVRFGNCEFGLCLTISTIIQIWTPPLFFHMNPISAASSVEFNSYHGAHPWQGVHVGLYMNEEFKWL